MGIKISSNPSAQSDPLLMFRGVTFSFCNLFSPFGIDEHDDDHKHEYANGSLNEGK